MTTTQDRLRALHAEASRQHVHFEKSQWNRSSMRKAINVTITFLALATAGSSAAGMPAGATALAIGLLVTVTLNLALTDTQRDRDLHRLTDAWRRHRTDAAQLLARHGAQRPADTPEKIQHETVELELRIAETRSESLLHGMTANVPVPDGNHENDPDSEPRGRMRITNSWERSGRTTTGGP